MSDWWLESVFYQVYIPSFQESDGNGIGDLRGVSTWAKLIIYF